MERDYRAIWNEFNHLGQPHYGIAKLALMNGDVKKAMASLAEFEKVWDEVSNHLVLTKSRGWVRCDELVRTDELVDPKVCEEPLKTGE